MTTTTILTVAEKILLAAHDLDRSGKERFTAEDLAVAAWKLDQDTFCMEGYPAFPDYNRTVSALSGRRGLPDRGLLLRVAPKLFALTREGRKLAALLLGDESVIPANEYITLSERQEKILGKILSSEAQRKFNAGQKMEVTFTNACHFWGISHDLKSNGVSEQLARVESVFVDLEKQLADSDARLGDGQIVTVGDIRAIRNMSRYLQDRFTRLLDLLRNRKAG